MKFFLSKKFNQGIDGCQDQNKNGQIGPIRMQYLNNFVHDEWFSLGKCNDFE